MGILIPFYQWEIGFGRSSITCFESDKKQNRNQVCLLPKLFLAYTTYILHLYKCTFYVFLPSFKERIMFYYKKYMFYKKINITQIQAKYMGKWKTYIKKISLSSMLKPLNRKLKYKLSVTQFSFPGRKSVSSSGKIIFP